MRKTLINPDTKVFPTNYLLQLLHFLKENNYNFTDIIKNSSLPNDPEQFVSYATLKQFLSAVLEHTQTPELGIYYGKALNFTAHGDIGHAIITSKNLYESIQMVIKYFKIRTPLIEITYHENPDDCMITAGFDLLPEDLESFLVDTYFATMLAIRKFILSDKHYDIALYLKRSKPKNPKPYYDYFGERVYFSSAQNEYHFPKESLTLAFPLSNPIAREIAERKCQQKMQELEHLDDLVSKIKKLMLSTPSYFPNLEELSQKLHMSTRTLRRKLQDLDTSYQEVLDELRKELAINYLQNSQLSILEIAHMLGFSDSSYFSAAFRKWIGQSPSDFRAQ